MTPLRRPASRPGDATPVAAPLPGPRPTRSGSDAGVPGGILRPFLGLLRPYRRRLALAVVVLVASIGATLAGPALVRYAINDGLVLHRSLRVIDLAAVGYAASAIATFYLARAQTRLVSSSGEHVLNDLRRKVFDHLLAQPLSFFEAESSGQLLSRMTADIDVLETLVQAGLGTLVSSVALFVLSVVVLVVMSPVLFLVTAACLPPAVVASLRYRNASTRAYRAVRERIGDLLAALEEGLAGVPVIQAFNRQRHQRAEFEEANQAQLDSELRAIRLSAIFFPKIEGSGVIAIAVILLAGAVLVHLHALLIGTVVAFVLYVTNLFDSIQNLSQLFDLLQSSGAALGTIFRLLATEPAMTSAARPRPLPEAGPLEIATVDFSYGGRAEVPVLADVALTVPEGEHLALVGPTGAGKSTLAKLAGRLYDPSRGAVRFGGVDLREASPAELRRRIVVMPQESFLFRGTVRENILLGRPDARSDDVERVVHALGLDAEFARLPAGLDTEVGERGAHLSAGQRQLVCLARAALADPAILIMDEATSSLDPGTEAAVEGALERLTDGRTTVVVAHRLTAAERADRVAVVDGGRLVELGPHEDLLAADGAYSRLFAAWAGRAEVEAEAAS